MTILQSRQCGNRQHLLMKLVVEDNDTAIASARNLRERTRSINGEN